VIWYDYIASFFAGMFLANAVPHFVHGISGDRFPTPFAHPPGTRIVIANSERYLGAVESARRLHPVSGGKGFERREFTACCFLRRHRCNQHNVERAICKETSEVTRQDSS
jgi:hypothetical protein